MSKLKQIIRLCNEGTALQAIVRGVSASRNTVKKYLRLIEVKGFDTTSLLQMGDIAMEALLVDNPDLEEQERLAYLEGLFDYLSGSWAGPASPDGCYGETCSNILPASIIPCSAPSLASRSRAVQPRCFLTCTGEKLFIDFTDK